MEQLLIIIVVLAAVLVTYFNIRHILRKVNKEKCDFQEKMRQCGKRVVMLLLLVTSLAMPCYVAARDSEKIEDYRNYLAVADAIVYSNFPSTIVIKTGERKDTFNDTKWNKKKTIIKWFLLDRNGKQHVVKPRSLNLAQAPVGACFEIKIDGDRIVYARAIDTPTCDWIKTIQGNLKMRTNAQGKRYAFLDDCYVGDKLLGNLPDGALVQVLAVKQENKWRGIACSPR